MKNSLEVNQIDIDRFKENYMSDSKAKIVRNALTKTGVDSVSFDREAMAGTNHQISIDIPTMKATNQLQSGRCWLFSGLNVLREKVAKKCNMKDFELSQNYVAFYDKFEKINYFLESVIDLVDKETDDRTLSWILKIGVQDGGQWDMIVSLIQKYGVVPKSAMEETFHSSSTRNVNQLINRKIRSYAYQLQKAYKKGSSIENLHEMKVVMLEEMYGLLCSCFGVPPTTFDFEYIDNDKKYHLVKDLTPNTFMEKYLDVELNDYISIINAPTKDKPYNSTFTVQYLGNVVGGKTVKYLNLEMSDFKSAILEQLKDNEIVWFGCDCGKYGDRDTGIWDDRMYDYDNTFDMSFELSKEAMLDYGESAMNHAMVITGVNLIDGKPTKWKIQNSWGVKAGNRGYYVMSDTWFDKFMYQAVVEKKYLPKELLECWDKEPIELKPWDPMGSLAD